MIKHETRGTRKSVSIFIFALCVFLLTPPFFIWNNHLFFGLFSLAIIAFISINNFALLTSREGIFRVSLFLLNILFYLSGVFNLAGFVIVVISSLVFLIKGDLLNKVFKIYVYIFSITMIPALILYLLVVILGINMPHTIIEPFNPLKEHDYKQYYFFVTANYYAIQNFRFLGIYDEPGVVGTTSAIILMSTGYNLRNKINWPIFLAGLVSLSLFFYIASLIYLLIFVKIKFRIPLLLIIISFYYVTNENEVLSKIIYERAQFENGSFAGDNRTSKEFDRWFVSHLKSHDLYFGMGRGANLIYNKGGASYKDTIVNYGIIPMIIYLSLILLLAQKYIEDRKQFFVFTVILLITLYQRPFIHQFYGTFVILGSLYSLSTKFKQQDQKVLKVNSKMYSDNNN